MTEEALFHAVLALPSAERHAYLDVHCSNPELRRRVEELLAAHERSAGPLESPATGDFVPSTSSVADASGSAGAMIGPYKLLQLIGEGGMGEVWMAEQEQPVRRRVALKLIKAGMDSQQVIARFEAERQVLALMDHPNIAKVLDAGTTPEGRPFFVMELVQGVAITKYCDQEHLSPEERLRLFIPICQAAQHAHQKGIIHRDLKPSNVMVGTYDAQIIPKVIDFGVAKAIGQRLTERSMFTEVGAIVGTFEYMSPEQAELNNLDIDTRADIYSLGVLLYELLAGSPPFTARELRSAAFTEMLRMIREVEPPKPSTKLSSSDNLPSIAANRKLEPKRLTKLMHGDLDWIAMKCLEKERSRRYETANQLALEVQRYLADEPVLAGPPSAAYRVRKFVRRNRGTVLAAVVVVLALAGGMVGATWGLFEARRERDAAEAAQVETAKERDLKEVERAKAAVERDRALAARKRTREALDAMVSGVTGESLATQKAISPEQKEFLQTVLPYYKEFAAEPGENREGRERLAEAHLRLGSIRYRLGQAAEESPIFRSAVGLYAGLAADFPAVPMYRQNLAKSHHNLGLVLADLGKRSEAVAAYRAALAVQEKLAADFPAVREYRRELARSHNCLGKLLAGLGKRPEAEAACLAALAVQEKLVADFPAVREYRQDLASSHNNLGVLLAAVGKRSEAEAAYRAALAVQEKLAADFPAVHEYRQDLANSHNNLGNLLRELGKHSEAEAAYRAALAVREKLAADFPAVPEYRRDLALSHNNLGILLAGLGKRPEAEAAYRAALAASEKLAADLPAVPEYRQNLARYHNNLGALLHELGKRPEAEAACRAALAASEKLAADFPAVPEYRRELARYHNNLGILLRELGKRPEAEAACRAALAASEKLAADFPAVPEYRQDLAKSHNSLGILLRELGKRPEAEAACRAALAASEKLAADFPTVPEYRQNLARYHNNLGALLHELGKRPEAETAYRVALTIQEKLTADFPTVPAYRRDLDSTRLALAMLVVAAGKVADATALASAVAAGRTVDGGTLYDCACVFALASAAANNPDADAHAARAVTTLRLAIAKGFRDIPHLLKDADLDPLRRRADYADLLWELADGLPPAK